MSYGIQRSTNFYNNRQRRKKREEKNPKQTKKNTQKPTKTNTTQNTNKNQQTLEDRTNKTWNHAIPITDGNGVSTIEDWELSTISNIEIHKGPAASSFGVGLGGTIILQPKYSQFNKPGVTFKTTYGSFGLQRSLVKAEISNKKMATNLLYSNTQNDGYRENNNYNRQTFTLTSLLNISSYNDCG